MQPTEEKGGGSEGIRINKFLVSCGYESRRRADELVRDGQVEINGKRAEAGERVHPGDYVKVNGRRVETKEPVTLLLNKPRGYVCSREPQGAEGTVYDLLPPKFHYVNYVGRLDTDSEGLLLMTNKGQYSESITRPANGVEKEYWVTLDRPFDNTDLVQLLKGVRIPEGQAKAKYVARLSPRRACVVLNQGMRRQLRQMFACLGYRVRKLVRVRIGSLWGGELMPGHAVVLTPEQEKLAETNPKRRSGLLGASQAFPAAGKLSREQLAEKMNDRETRRAIAEDAHYQFNPDDFEDEEEASSESDFETERSERKKSTRRPQYSPHRRRGDRVPAAEAPRRPHHRREAPSKGRGRRNFGAGARSGGPRRNAGARFGSGAGKQSVQRKRDGKRAVYGGRRPTNGGGLGGQERPRGRRHLGGKGRDGRARKKHRVER